ncbi:MAG: hypothetical protein ABSG81_00840 [Acidimicrobiales bacterium]
MTPRARRSTPPGSGHDAPATRGPEAGLDLGQDPGVQHGVGGAGQTPSAASPLESLTIAVSPSPAPPAATTLLLLL